METSFSDDLSSCGLHRDHPGEFEAYVERYADLVELSVQESVHAGGGAVLVKLRSLARTAGAMDAVPADLIAVHLSALARMVKTKPQPLVRAGIRQSRLLLVKMIGELALYYKDRSAERR